MSPVTSENEENGTFTLQSVTYRSLVTWTVNYLDDNDLTLAPELRHYCLVTNLNYKSLHVEIKNFVLNQEM